MNPNLISDLGVAAVLAEASVRAAAYNVRINLRHADEPDPHDEVRKETQQLLERAQRTRDSISAFVDGYL